MTQTRKQCYDAGQLRQLLAEQLPPDEESKIVQHVNRCTTCQRLMESAAAGEQVWNDLRKTLDNSDNNLMEPTIEVQQVTLDRVVEYLGPTDNPEMIGRLGSYEVCGIVGQGSTGVVAKAFEPSLNRFVAIKLLSPAIAASGPARHRFAREARAAAAVLHENVIPIYAVDEYQGLPYIVMQYVAGGSLQYRIDKRGPLDAREVVRIATQVSNGLAAAHAQGIVHRDVKPANIMLESNVDRAVVSDFGLARVADDAAVTRSGVIAGTPQFMSPEQARGEGIDHRSDLFSLGAVMYTACTARLPFQAETVFGVIQRVCDVDPLPIRETNPEIPRWLEAFIEKLLSKRREDRFETAEQVAEHLSLELAHLQSATATATPARPWLAGHGSERDQRSNVRSAVLLLAAVALFGLVFAFFAAPPRLAESDNRIDSAAVPSQPAPVEAAPATRRVARIAEFDITDQRTFAAAAGGKLILELDRGAVDIRTADQAEVGIHVKRVVRAASQEEADRLSRGHTVTYEPSGDGLRVAGRLAPGQDSAFQRIAVRLTVPPDYQLDIATAGDIVLSDVRVSRSRLKSTGGSITATDVAGDLVAYSSGGNIELQNVTGSIESLASGGMLRVLLTEPPQDSIHLRNSDGDVKVIVAEDFPLNIEAHSRGGRITSTFTTIADGCSDVEFSLLGGGPALSAHTNGGQISLEYLPDHQAAPTALAIPVSDITVDGDLTDWPDGMPVYELAARTADPVGNGDVAANFRVGYDPAAMALFAAVVVTDQQIVFNGQHGDHWNAQDSCEVYVDVPHVPWTTQPSQFYFRRQAGSFPLDRREATQVVRNVQAGRIVYEWKIDLDRLSEGDTPRLGDTIGFDVVICDRDDERNMKMLAWGPHSDEKWRDSLKLSNLQLVERLPANR